MNFLAHYIIATRFLTPTGPLPAYAVGTALPDLLPLAAGRARLRPARLEASAARTGFEAALSAGILAHLQTDAAFHKSLAFAEASAAASRIVAGAGFDGIRVRRFFAAHVLTEMALDAALLRAESGLAGEFYTAFAGADFSGVARWAEAVAGKPLPDLPDVLTRFARSQYLHGYAEDGGVATGFSNTCRRAGQDTFEGENFTRLTGIVGEIIGGLPPRVPALLSETAAGILRARQEVERAAANAASEET